MKYAPAILCILLFAFAAIPANACEDVTCGTCGAVYKNGTSCPNAGNTCSVCGASTHNSTGTCPNANKKCPVCGASMHGRTVCPQANDKCTVCGASMHGKTVCPNAGKTCPDCGENIHGELFHLCSGKCPVCGEKSIYDVKYGTDENGKNIVLSYRCKFDEDTCSICGRSSHTNGHHCETYEVCDICGTEYMHAESCPNAGNVCKVCGKSTHNKTHECPDAIYAVCGTCGAHTHEDGTCPNDGLACTVCGNSLHSKSWTCLNEFRVCYYDCEVMTHTATPKCPLDPQWKCPKCGMYSKHGSACTNGCKTLHHCIIIGKHSYYNGLYSDFDNKGRSNPSGYDKSPYSQTYRHYLGFCQECGELITSPGDSCPNANKTCDVCKQRYHGDTCPNVGKTVPCPICSAAIPHGGTCPNVNGITCGVCGASVPHGGTCPHANDKCTVCGASMHGKTVCPNANGTTCPTCLATIPHGGKCPNASGMACPLCATQMPHGGPCPNAANHAPYVVSVNGVNPATGGAITVSLPLDILAKCGVGGTVNLYCHSATRAGWTCPKLTRTGLKKTASPVAMYLFGRRIFPTLATIQGDFIWDADEEFILVITTKATWEDALEEMQGCCAAAGCPRHVRVKCRQSLRPMR